MSVEHGVHLGFTTLIVVVAGLVAQWVAWRVRIPAIIVLIGTGLLLGPVAVLWGGILDIDSNMPGFQSLIGLGVALVLFEGGLDLELREFRRVGTHIRRLVVLGPPIAWGLGAVAAHYIGGLSWPVSLVLGAMLVVTGPTVIQPLLRHAKLNQDSASLLKWEGIVNDPTGVLLAVLVYQYFIYSGDSSSAVQVLLDLGKAVSAALLFGGLGGWLIGKVYARGLVPEHLKPPVLMALVLVAYELANLFQHEAGLLAVTLMGVVLANIKLGGLEELRRFKENLSIILVSALFIVLTASLNVDVLKAMDVRSILLIVAFLLLVRPLSIWLATLGSGMRHTDRMLLAWIAPRGIVAAATAGLFGPAMLAAGYFDADQLLPIVFGMILVTVILHGLTIAGFSKRLGLSAQHDGGLLIVGANPFSIALAQALGAAGISVKLVDGSWPALKPARLAGLDFYYGELLSEHAKDWVSLHHLNAVLCTSDNHFYNALVCKALAGEFGQHNVFQLPASHTMQNKNRRLERQQRGHIAWRSDANIVQLNELLNTGWTIQLTRITAEHGMGELEKDLDEGWILLGTVAKSGIVTLNSLEVSMPVRNDERVMYFAPPRQRKSEQSDESADHGADAIN